jgi:hypothetical protein
MGTVPQQAVLFPDLFSRPLKVEFSEEHLSSFGGSVLLRAADRRLRLTERLASGFRDPRQPAKIDHTVLELVRQRIFALGCGCPDGNDAARLRQDPMMKLVCDRDPLRGEPLGSQPTLSRLENRVSRSELYRMGEVLVDVVLRAQQHRRRGKRRPRRIIIDLDPTCDPTHGTQQLTFFNGYYDCHCYLPLVVTISFDKERRKYPVAIVLRAGNAGAMDGVLAVLERLIARIRRYFPRGTLYFRADAAYAEGPLFDFLDRRKVRYAVGMGANPVLRRLSAEYMSWVRPLAEEQQRSIALHGQGLYQAGSWSWPRMAAYKAEVLVKDGEAADNDRYVIHTLPGTFGGEGVFKFYHGHSDEENTIKELKLEGGMDRTSCSSFAANQLRVLWSLAAYLLVQTLGERARCETLAGATMGTLRVRLLLVAVRVHSTVRRLWLEVAAHHPWAEQWLSCAKSLGAVPT